MCIQQSKLNEKTSTILNQSIIHTFIHSICQAILFMYSNFIIVIINIFVNFLTPVEHAIGQEHSDQSWCNFHFQIALIQHLIHDLIILRSSEDFCHTDNRFSSFSLWRTTSKLLIIRKRSVININSSIMFKFDVFVVKIFIQTNG